MCVVFSMLCVLLMLSLLCRHSRDVGIVECVVDSRPKCVCFGVCVCVEMSPLWCVVCADTFTTTTSRPSVRGLLRDWEV